jgi:hypothetical protein
MPVSFSGEINPNPLTRSKKLTSQVTDACMLLKYAADPAYVGLATTGDQCGCFLRSRTTRTTAQIAEGKNMIDVETLKPGDVLTFIASGVVSVGLDKYAVPDTGGKIKQATTHATPVATWVLLKPIEASTTDGDKILCEVVLNQNPII